jgi:hypothetical protein
MATGFVQRFKGKIAAQVLYFVGAKRGLTALAGGAQAGTKLSFGLNVVSTVATGNDSAALPPAKGSGGIVIVKNAAAANSLQVFGTDPDTINGIATGTGVAQAHDITCLYIDVESGKWSRFLGA